MVVVGHTEQRTGEILDLGFLKCIDTFCHGGGWLTALVGMNRARSCAEFREASRPWLVPTFNVVFADVTGHIGFQSVGRVPVRAKEELPLETTVVSGNGGCLLFDKNVNEGQNLKLADSNGMSFGVNVRYFDYDAVNNRRVVGFRVIEPRSGWGQNVMTHLGY